MPAPFRAIWLGDNADNGIVRPQQGLKRSRRKIWCAHEHETHVIALTLQMSESNLDARMLA
jgi:hypothetical protein